MVAANEGRSGPGKLGSGHIERLSRDHCTLVGVFLPDQPSHSLTRTPFESAWMFYSDMGFDAVQPDYLCGYSLEVHAYRVLARFEVLEEFAALVTASVHEIWDLEFDMAILIVHFLFGHCNLSGETLYLQLHEQNGSLLALMTARGLPVPFEPETVDEFLIDACSPTNPGLIGA